MGISAPLSKYYHKNCSEPPKFYQNLEMIALRSFNQLMITCVTTNPAPLPGPSTSLRGKKTHMSGMNTSNRQFSITPKDKLQDQLTPIQSMQYTQINNQQKYACVKNLKYILDQSKQSIDVNKQLHSTGTLAMTLYKPAGK